MMNPLTNNFRNGLAFLSLMVSISLEGQGFLETSKFIESENARYGEILNSAEKDLVSVASKIHPNARDLEIHDKSVVIKRSFMVYEKAMVGNRPFGKVRYQVRLGHAGDDLICEFTDFTFTRYERNARYGRMMEVRRSRQPLSDAKADLNEIQWGILRWRTAVEINQSVESIPTEVESP